MNESKLKTVVKYRAKGNKTFKDYDAIVTEAIKGQYITVEIEEMIGQFSLEWDSFMYVADLFGNTITCDYEVTRNFTAKKLGFSKPTDNSIDSVSDRDFALDFLSSASICAMHISRFAEELIIWNSDIFKLIKLDDKMLTGSSIMPQKKNPDPAELIRGRAGKNFGLLQAMLTTMKGLPLSYYKDMQEDKTLVFNSYDTLLESIVITNELIKNLKPNKERMLFLSNDGYTTATDFADYLVQNNNLSFREAYKISAKLVNYAEKNKKKLNQLDFDEVKKMKNDLDKNVMKVFNVRNSVNLKTSYGGTSTKNIKKMISKLKKEFK